MHFSTRSIRPGPVLALVLAVGVSWSAACATSGAVPRPFPGAPVASGATEPGAVVAGSETTIAPDLLTRRFNGRAVAQFAMGFRGVPYRLGGADPGGFDCSGLVQYVFAQYGISVPRVVEEQYEVGDKVRPADIKPGDLIFFNTTRRGGGASHVGIATGEDSFVHAPNSTGVVRVESLGSGYWGSRYVGARRIGPPISARRID